MKILVSYLRRVFEEATVELSVDFSDVDWLSEDQLRTAL